MGFFNPLIKVSGTQNIDAEMERVGFTVEVKASKVGDKVLVARAKDVFKANLNDTWIRAQIPFWQGLAWGAQSGSTAEIQGGKSVNVLKIAAKMALGGTIGAIRGVFAGIGAALKNQGLDSFYLAGKAAFDRVSESDLKPGQNLDPNATQN